MSFLRKNAVAALGSLARTRHAAGVAAFLPRYSAPAFSRTLATNSHLKPRLAQKTEAEPFENDSRNVSQQPDSPGTRIFVGNIPFTSSQEGIAQHFSSCGEIESMRLHKHNVTGNFTGSATITFATVEAAKAAIALHDVALDGRPLLVEEAIEGSRKRPRETSEFTDSPRNPPTSTLYVGNLPYSTTKEDLEELFEAHNPTAVRIGVDRATMESKGFAHVAFETVEDAQEAFEAVKRADVHGRRVKLDFAAERKPNDPGALRTRGAGGSRRSEFGGRGSGRQGGSYRARDGGEDGFGFRKNGGDQ